MRKRGAALPTILALITVVLVAGLAMGSMSALSLQFNQKQMARAQSELAARSGLARFLAVVKEHEMDRSESEQLNPLEPAPFDVAELLSNGLEFEEDGVTVSMHFNQEKAGYSTDNSTGEGPARGWSDKDDVARIPPFAMDLVFKVEGAGGGPHYYRAILKRVWPFALYSAVGPVTLMGNPEDAGAPPGARPSYVDGDVYTQWRSQEAAGGSKVVGYGLGPLDQPSKLLANIEARQGYHPGMALTQQPLHIGMTLGRNPYVTPDFLEDESDDENVYFSYPGEFDLDGKELSPIFGVSNDGISDGGNFLEGNFVIDYDADLEIKPIVFDAVEENGYEGKVSVRRGLALDPLYYFRADKEENKREFDSSGFTQVTIPVADHEAEELFDLEEFGVYDDEEPALLTETLRLSPDENSTGGAKSPHYKIVGNVSNRQVFLSDNPGDKLCVRECAAGLELQDVVLHVEGNLDLGASHFEEPIRIVGSGATLVVDGQLVVGNAQFDAVDQGFVIFAEDIVLTGSGEFRGLMIASNSISILSREDGELTIYGGLMCGGPGGVMLRGTRVIHEPRYLKAINGGGDFYLHAWNRL